MIFVPFTYKSREFLVNPAEITAVGHTESGRAYIAICGRPFTCDQPFAEVVRRLGIEVPHE